MSEKRRDNRNRILREGEYQRTDGRYRYRYIDEDGKEKNVYSWYAAIIYQRIYQYCRKKHEKIREALRRYPGNIEI